METPPWLEGLLLWFERLSLRRQERKRIRTQVEYIHHLRLLERKALTDDERDKYHEALVALWNRLMLDGDLWEIPTR